MQLLDASLVQPTLIQWMIYSMSLARDEVLQRSGNNLVIRFMSVEAATSLIVAGHQLSKNGVQQEESAQRCNGSDSTCLGKKYKGTGPGVYCRKKESTF